MSKDIQLDFKDFGQNIQQDLDAMTFDGVVKTTKKQMKE